MTESDTTKYYYGIRYVVEDEFEFIVHKVVTNSRDDSKNTRIAAMGTNLQGLHDSLNEFTPNRIYIYHEQTQDPDIEISIREYCNDETEIEHRVNEDKNDIVNTARTFFSDINKKQKSIPSDNDRARITKFMNEIDEMIKNNKKVTIDQDYKWIRVGNKKIHIERDKPYPLMILCWSLSLLAVKDGEGGWYEKVKDDKKTTPRHFIGQPKGRPKIYDNELGGSIRIDDMYDNDEWMRRL